jgi:hypothetical protein
MLICVIQRYFADPGVSRFFVAWLPPRDLLLRAKHLFVAARTVWHGLQSSRDEHDRLGFGRLGNHLKSAG